ncbi:Rho GTPase activation protein [Mucor lusitanicus]|uniref:Rho GTPase activation protein n=1 Tax=Mucor circinelloides f. lusitanicus TaxID=29924 RepID=A0A8H4B7T6_MUCCL|nr:Rho GTPase activation protein [Mucor lusitanicus]
MQFLMLESYVEKDYAMIFFSSPAHHKPSWIWLLKAYRQLDHSFKKNLKALYVLHMSKSYQHVFNLANKIISPKFSDKVSYLATLDELDKIIDLAHVKIPHEVVEYELALPHSLFGYHHHYYHDQSQHAHHRNNGHHHHTHHHHHYQAHQKKEAPTGQFVFGRDLEALAKVEGVDISDQQSDVYIPTVVQKLIEHVRSNGLQQEGIFRKSPSNADLSKARNELDQNHSMFIEHLDVHTAASLLKMFLAGLPRPLISSEFVTMHSQNEDAADLGHKLRCHYKDKPHHFALLQYLVFFLAQVSEHADCNKMTIHNLAIVFSPSLIRSTVAFDDILTSPADAAVYLGQMKLHMAFIEFLIKEKDAIFSTR